MRAPLGQAGQIGDVLEHRHVVRRQDAVRLEQPRLAEVDAGGVDADGAHRALDQPLGRGAVQAGKAQLGHRGRAALGGAQVALGIRPIAAVAGADQHDRAGRQLAVARFPTLEGGDGDLVVGIGQRAGRRVDHRGRADQAFERNLRHAVAAFGEVARRVDVRAAVFGAAKGVGFVPKAASGGPGARHAQLESGGGGPVDGVLRVVVGQIDPLAGKPVGRRGASVEQQAEQQRLRGLVH